MRDKKQLLLAIMVGASALSASALTPAFGENLTLWLADKYGGAAPSHAADAPSVVVIKGAKYGLSEGAAKNLDAATALVLAADAMGMVRNNDYENPQYNTVGGSTHAFEYTASGTVGGQKVNVVVGMDYRGPSIRAQTERADKSKDILVASGELAWDESKPGIFQQAAKTSAADRLMQIYLLPAAVVQEGVAQVNKIKVATVGGNRELTVPLPKYSSEIKATLNAKDEITHSEMKVGGKLYTADFSDYQNDKMDYHVMFPHKIVQKVDGATTADLTVSEHWIGPYLVWPVPKEIKK